MIDLGALVQSALELEPLPASVTRLASTVADPDSDLQDVVEILEFDQALTGRLLRAANSASSASSSAITSVRAAVLRLGSGSILSMATASCVQTRMNHSVPAYGLGEGALWRHSVATALAAESVNRAAKRKAPPESFTAALLHDIGKLTLARFLDDEVVQILRRADACGLAPSLQAETEVLGVNHAELGGLIAQHWSLPTTIVLGIIFHHDPGAVSNTHWSTLPGVQAVCDVVHVGNVLAQRIAAEGDDVEVREPLDEASLARLGLTEADLPRLSADVADRLEHVLVRYD